MVAARLSVQSLALCCRCSKIGGCNNRLCQAHYGMKMARREKLTRIGGGMSADLVNAQEGPVRTLTSKGLVPREKTVRTGTNSGVCLMYPQRVCSPRIKVATMFLKLSI